MTEAPATKTDAEDVRPRIVVGVDGSEHSKLALRWAARLASAEGARIDAIFAWEIPANLYGSYGYFGVDYPTQAEMEKVLTDTVDDVFGGQRPNGLQLHPVRGGAAAALLDASRDAIMLVVGSRGHGGFMGLLLGSVSAKVAEHGTCPVLVVHGPRAGS